MATPEEHGDASQRAPMLWCLVAAALFGASTPAAKALLGPMGALLLSGLLYAGAAIAVAPWAVRGLGSLRRLDRANLGRLAGAVVCGGVIGPVLLLWGLGRAPAMSVALWLNLETVATAALARLLFREHLNARALVAMALIVVASAVMTQPSLHGGAALILVGLACVAWGLDNNLTAVIDGVTPAQTTFLKGLVAGTVNVSLAVALGAGAPPAGAALGALVIGMASYGASILLYIAGAQQLGAMRSQLVFSTAPLWGVSVAWLWLGESLGPAQGAAAGLVAVALWLLHRERHVHEHAHDPVTHTHWHRHDDGHHGHEHAGVRPWMWHAHEHSHQAVVHAHTHRPDIHHRHRH